jgi:hypothetical protein
MARLMEPQVLFFLQQQQLTARLGLLQPPGGREPNDASANDDKVINHMYC